jgi:hypothetical protein
VLLKEQLSLKLPLEPGIVFNHYFGCENEPVAQIDPIQFLIVPMFGNALMRNISTFGSTTKTELLYGAVTKLWVGNVSIMKHLPQSEIHVLELF